MELIMKELHLLLGMAKKTIGITWELRAVDARDEQCCGGCQERGKMGGIPHPPLRPRP